MGLKRDWKRIIRHLAATPWMLRRAFPLDALERVERAVAGSERAHRGELRVAVEGGLDLLPLMKGITPRGRALEVFSSLRVWDTAENSGVLIYLQLVDQDIEIVADRGISAVVPQPAWDSIVHRMEQAFRDGRHEQGVLDGIEEITALLARHFPAGGANPDELADRPALL